MIGFNKSIAFLALFTLIAGTVSANDIRANYKNLLHMGFGNELTETALELIGDPYKGWQEGDEEVYQDGKLVNVIQQKKRLSREEVLMKEAVTDQGRDENELKKPLFPVAVNDPDNRLKNPVSLKNATLKSSEVPQEIDYVVEQLYALGLERGFKAADASNDRIPEKLSNYWNKVGVLVKQRGRIKQKPVSQTIKNLVKAHFYQGAKQMGFIIQKFDMEDGYVPEGKIDVAKVRLYVEGYHPQKMVYEKARALLRDIHKLAEKSCRVNGKDYLAPISTFITKNMKARLYYARTHIQPR